ncbi:MAG: ABC transporter substrate-binding protein [Lentisphaerae bacterium]|jgi:NitT/TauT family transport system substrate-binding protein|nr:ABC transporter substrate-binding protein [Lentisphaerota bacterium]MBT4819313.1 ABC transporter substrate-binding protein [Lentisphaerota bacterium]MBT5606543.1 ABC transporter substrate-binding protein [Lentisphaerota bacterium]MBT7053452.1 ABC transporter substrate-binding protein [Lentisphaerota bacterium]MBT7846805.1 ABC transporter substrate-binding protein [Lentisphaerota bacterium]
MSQAPSICVAHVCTVCALTLVAVAQSAPVILRVGHVGHDHHTALYVAADCSKQWSTEDGARLERVQDRKRYNLYLGSRHLAELELARVGGGAKMPTALAQGAIDIGLGGTAPVLAACDKGAPIRLIAPLHNKGDVFVVNPDFPASSWSEFVAVSQATKRPIRIGYKSPMACAKVIFEGALRHAGLRFSSDPRETDAQIHLVNLKGGSKLNASLAAGLVSGYVGNNPFPAIGEEKGILKAICDLEALPPGDFLNHPCCCVAAGTDAIREKAAAIEVVLGLLLNATVQINRDLPGTAAIAARWIGTTPAVELKSLPTSGYSLAANDSWHRTMGIWIQHMNALGILKKELKGLDETAVAKRAYDLSMLGRAVLNAQTGRAED